jgi:Tol biopolymer transport system component
MKDVLLDVRTGETSGFEHLESVDQAADYQVSPDGTMVAFTGAGEEGDPRYVYVAEVDGTLVRPMTDGPSAASAPQWSPDCERLVYSLTGGSEGFIDILIVDVDGATDSRRALTGDGITHTSRSEFWQVGTGASFAPDGRTILFTRATRDGVRS